MAKITSKKKTATKYKGVSWVAERNSYRVRVCANGTKYHIGYYRTATAAAKEYNTAALNIIGENATLNRV